MSPDDESDPQRPAPQQVLVIVLALAGIVATLMLSTIPTLAGVAVDTGYAVVIGAVNVAGYVAMILVVAQSPLRWDLVRRIAAVMIVVDVLAAIASVTVLDSRTSGPSFLLAMSSVMAVVIVLVEFAMPRR
ncbi:hypothetical protein AAFP30_05380 [Gordonia sp. CPCC 205515]|uniref:hypothetical protein n=1 Tax=Gordonia sp. CPCC 205515 TaxID=3140791 RepID=UPI003AF3FCA3